MSEKLKLYIDIGSQPARAVKALLDIGKIEYEQVPISLLKGETKSPEYLKINPLGQIPFLLISENEGIGESNAILQYLCEKYPEKLGNFYSEQLIQKTKINEALSWYQGSFRPAFMARIKLKIYGTYSKGIPHTESQLKQADLLLGEALKTLEKILNKNGGPYIAGKNISIADILIFFEITNLIYYDMEDTLKQFEKCQTLYDDIGNIPEIKEIQLKWQETVPNFKALLKKLQPIKN